MHKLINSFTLYEERFEMGKRDIETLELLESYVEKGFLDLNAISDADYDTLEMLCDQLLHWKLFISNNHFQSKAVEKWLQNCSD
jgi:hypothetical protein